MRGMGQGSTQRGFTLVEAIVALVVMGLALAGLLLAFDTLAGHTADPIVQRQMQAIAQEMLEEIQLKPFAAEKNESTKDCERDVFNDLADYDGYATHERICTVDGVEIAALKGYSLQVKVSADALVDVKEAMRIDVTVTRGSDSLTLTGWRTDYGS